MKLAETIADPARKAIQSVVYIVCIIVILALIAAASGGGAYLVYRMAGMEEELVYPGSPPRHIHAEKSESRTIYSTSEELDALLKDGNAALLRAREYLGTTPADIPGS